MKILILGHEGMLGSDLLIRLSLRHEVAGKDIDDFDITSPDSCQSVIAEAGPDWVVNAAAYTDVDGCETEQDRCYAINALGVKNVALACKERGIKLVHFSTDYVFDGRTDTPYREDDPSNPLNVYGRSKLAGERFLTEISPDFILIRTAWLYGKRGKNFLKTILRNAREKGELAVVDDQIGSPTYSWDLAGAVQVLLEGEHTGVFHITNRGTCSWHEFAVKIVKYAGMEDVMVNPIGSERLARPAPRPAYSVLSNRKFVQATGKTMQHWQIALQDCLEKMGYRQENH